LNASKKEIVDQEALIERYRKEIEELKAKLVEKEATEKKINRRLSTREVCRHTVNDTGFDDRNRKQTNEGIRRISISD
jgi:hypothetical protein